MVLLLVTDHIHHLIDRIVLEAKLRRTDILGHIDRSTVRTEQQFFVESILGEVCPDGSVFAAVELTGRQAFLDFGLALEVGVRFIIDLIERHAETLVGLVKTGIDPFVHLRPQGTYLRIVRFPFAEHLLRLQHQRRFLLRGLFVHAFRHELRDLRFVLLIETDVVIADQMIAFLTAGLRRLAVTELEPCEHGLADMDASVVDDVGLDDLPTIRLLNLRNRITEQVITHMTQMQRLIRVWRTIFHHHELMAIGLLTIVSLRINRL